MKRIKQEFDYATVIRRLAIPRKLICKNLDLTASNVWIRMKDNKWRRDEIPKIEKIIKSYENLNNI